MQAMSPVRVVSFVLAFGFAGGALHAQSWEMPSDTQRCPSKWGANDEVGSGNLMKPEMALKAAKLIRTGEVFTLGFHLSAGLPLIGSRRFDMHMKRGTATDPGTRGENEEIVITELGQVGTQLDAFAHQIFSGEYYNCVTDHEMSFSEGANDLSAGARQGFPKLGVEKIPDIMTRGVLIDVAGLKNVDMLPGGYVISADDLQQALAKEKLKLETGDAVMINTGWGKLYTVKDKDKYLKSSPGIGIEAGEWLVKQNPMLVGTESADSRDVSDCEWGLPCRKSEAGTTRGGTCVRNRVHHDPLENRRRDGFDYRSDRGSMREFKSRGIFKSV
jgi:hypothetical protein